jgi:hypothetical protein
MTAVLRVDGNHVDIDACLKLLPQERIESTWRTGEPDRLGRVSRTSGFNLLLSEEEDSQTLVSDTIRTLLSIADRLTDLFRDGATAEVDFALFIGPVAPGSIRLDADAMRPLVQLGIAIVVSAYPSGD